MLIKNLFFSVLFVLATQTNCIAANTPALPSTDAISRIDLMLMPEGSTTIRPLREEDLSTWGCTFTASEDVKQLNDILSILRANITASENADDYTLKNLIVIFLKNGEKVRFLLSDARTAQGRTLGTFYGDDSSRGVAIASDRTLLEQLRNVARNVKARKNFSESCIQ